ncbi:MAG TPA: MmgE/PrpD family protein, partial [Bryobacteraceae bacterium]|nr:MmgE/PrpD family protein [Bryobacteraceae bacterium]
TPEQTAHAVALCATMGLSLGAARSGEHVAQWKGLAAPGAAFEAIHLVRLAQAGITGPLHVFEGPMGLRQALGKDFGIRWDSEGYDGILACSIKKHNAEFHAQSLIDAVLELRTRFELKAADVQRIDVEIFKAAYEMIGGGKYVNPRTVRTKEDADHSLPYLVAVALIDGQVQPEQFEESRIQREDVQELMRRVESRERHRFTAEYPMRLHERVTAHGCEGKPIQVEKREYEGFFARPMAWEAVMEKFRGLCGTALPEERQNRVIEYVRGVEQRPITELFAALAPSHGAGSVPSPMERS